MSYRHRKWLLALRGLTAIEYRVLDRLGEYADDSTGQLVAWPAVATLARDCEVSERSVQNALGTIRGRGLIDAVAQPGQHQPVRYQLNSGVQTVHPSNSRGANGSIQGCKPFHSGVQGLHPNLLTEPSQRERNTHNAREAARDGGISLSRSAAQGSKQASPIAQDWCPGSGAMDVAERHLGDAWSDQVEVFKAHFRARANETRTDWDAAFEEWCINASRYQRLDRERPARATPSGPGNKKTQGRSSGALAPLPERVQAYWDQLPEECGAREYNDIEVFQQMARALKLENWRGDIAEPLECFTAFLDRFYSADDLFTVCAWWMKKHVAPPKRSSVFGGSWERYCPRPRLSADGSGEWTGTWHDGQLRQLRQEMREGLQ